MKPNAYILKEHGQRRGSEVLPERFRRQENNGLYLLNNRSLNDNMLFKDLWRRPHPR